MVTKRFRSLLASNYPNTRVSFVVGEDDCSTAPAMGSPYILGVLGNSTGPSDVAVLPEVGHAEPAFEQGAAAIEAVLVAADGFASSSKIWGFAQTVTPFIHLSLRASLSDGGEGVWQLDVKRSDVLVEASIIVHILVIKSLR